ncbi:hypothetical protein WG66_003865 [Moniliophthora roreri]|nr:hypothetical protein WG66_003865 [Moniliophthora roreri]
MRCNPFAQPLLDKRFFPNVYCTMLLPSSNAPPDSFSCLIPEILSDIFTYCSNETAILNGSDAPWTLTRVSRHWREVALDTPSNVDLPFHRLRHHFALADSGLPLHIVIRSQEHQRRAAPYLHAYQKIYSISSHSTSS